MKKERMRGKKEGVERETFYNHVDRSFKIKYCENLPVVISENLLKELKATHVSVHIELNVHVIFNPLL